MIGKITKIEKINDEVRAFYFEPAKKLEYLAGQYVDIRPPGAMQSHWYTLSSSPSEDELFFTTVFLEQISHYKQKLLELKPGDDINYSDSIGDYVLPKDPSVPLIFIAGGIGITPVRSVIKYLTDTDDKRQVELFYYVKNEGSFIFKSILEAYSMHFVPVVTRPHADWPGQSGRPSAERIEKLSELIDKNPFIFISGPRGMVEDLTEKLSKVVGRQRIIMDYFPGYLDF